MPELEYSKLKRSALSRVTLVVPDNNSLFGVTGFMVSDFDIAGSNQFATFWSDASPIATARDITRFGSELAGSPFKLEHFGLSKFSWQSSSRFKCTLNLLFVEVDRDDNTIREVQSLLKTVYPIREDTVFIRPPLGYGIRQRGLTTNTTSPTGSGTAGAGGIGGVVSDIYSSGRSFIGEILSGTPRNGIAISIGSWFATQPLFVVEQLALKMSKIPTDSGRPLWLTASISLVSFRMNPVDEVLGWFIGGGEDSTVIASAIEEENSTSTTLLSDSLNGGVVTV